MEPAPCRPHLDHFSLRTPLCWLGLPFMMRPVEVSRLNQVLPTWNSLRPLTAPTRWPRPVFFATSGSVSGAGGQPLTK